MQKDGLHHVSVQSCPTPHDPMDCSLPDSSVHGLFQGRILEQVAFYNPGDLSDPGIESMHPQFPALAGRFFTISVRCSIFLPSLYAFLWVF